MESDEELVAELKIPEALPLGSVMKSDILKLYKRKLISQGYFILEYISSL